MGEEISSRLEKAISILDMLSCEDWIGRAAISKELGIDVSTVSRYIKSLKSMGYDIESSRGRGYRLGANFSEGQLLLAEEELYTLFLSLARSTGSFSERIVENLRRRLINQLSLANRRKAQRLRDTVAAGNGYAFEPDFQVLSNIFGAISQGKCLRLSYQGLKDLEPKIRRVGPLSIVDKYGTWHLEGWDLDKSGGRTFRLDRISSSDILDDRFNADRSTVEFKNHPWDFNGEQVTVQLKLQAGLAQWLDKNPKHWSQSLQFFRDGSALCSFQVSQKEKFIDWVIGLRGVELLSPPSYQEALVKRALGVAANIGTPDIEWEV